MVTQRCYRVPFDTKTWNNVRFFPLSPLSLSLLQPLYFSCQHLIVTRVTREEFCTQISQKTTAPGPFIMSMDALSGITPYLEPYLEHLEVIRKGYLELNFNEAFVASFNVLNSNADSVFYTFDGFFSVFFNELNDFVKETANQGHVNDLNAFFRRRGFDANTIRLIRKIMKVAPLAPLALTIPSPKWKNIEVSTGSFSSTHLQTNYAVFPDITLIDNVDQGQPSEEEMIHLTELSEGIKSYDSYLGFRETDCALFLVIVDDLDSIYSDAKDLFRMSAATRHVKCMKITITSFFGERYLPLITNIAKMMVIGQERNISDIEFSYGSAGAEKGSKVASVSGSARSRPDASLMVSTSGYTGERHDSGTSSQQNPESNVDEISYHPVVNIEFRRGLPQFGSNEIFNSSYLRDSQGERALDQYELSVLQQCIQYLLFVRVSNNLILGYQHPGGELNILFIKIDFSKLVFEEVEGSLNVGFRDGDTVKPGLETFRYSKKVETSSGEDSDTKVVSVVSKKIPITMAIERIGYQSGTPFLSTQIRLFSVLSTSCTEFPNTLDREKQAAIAKALWKYGENEESSTDQNCNYFEENKDFWDYSQQKGYPVCVPATGEDLVSQISLDFSFKKNLGSSMQINDDDGYLQALSEMGMSILTTLSDDPSIALATVLAIPNVVFAKAMSRLLSSPEILFKWDKYLGRNNGDKDKIIMKFFNGPFLENIFNRYRGNFDAFDSFEEYYEYIYDMYFRNEVTCLNEIHEYNSAVEPSERVCAPRLILNGEELFINHGFGDKFAGFFLVEEFLSSDEPWETALPLPQHIIDDALKQITIMIRKIRIQHGDLSLRNMILHDGRVHFIDYGHSKRLGPTFEKEHIDQKVMSDQHRLSKLLSTPFHQR